MAAARLLMPLADPSVTVMQVGGRCAGHGNSVRGYRREAAQRVAQTRVALGRAEESTREIGGKGQPDEARNRIGPTREKQR